MIFSEFIVNELIKHGTSDAFGIPGGVILKLLAAMKKAEPVFRPHLCFSEQDAGFAALGYAQASGNLGVAYATRGPGITNMVTCIAEAYQESLPVLFITAHGKRTENKIRFNENQELNIVNSVLGFTKFAANAETVDEAVKMLKKALSLSTDGRNGPVLLDFATSVFDKEVITEHDEFSALEKNVDVTEAVNTALNLLSSARRPLLLIGDGLRCFPKEKLRAISNKLRIPVLSSRGSQDLLGGSDYYFGYLGSHGTRYSNFILSKADLILSVGNRMAFPIDSASFSPIIKNSRIFRVDIDENELSRHIPNECAFSCDGGMFLEQLCDKHQFKNSINDWFNVCTVLKKELKHEDCSETVIKLSSFISSQSDDTYYVCDVGNNEFLFSRAYELSGSNSKVYCSKSFGTLGSSIGRAIGVYYATHCDIICVCGDQGFQYNLQELQYISNCKLPIKIVLLNNHRSGMIEDHEKNSLGGVLIHVDENSGYSTPDFSKIAESYCFTYTTNPETACTESKTPMLYEISTTEYEALRPTLPRGNSCQDMFPLLDRSKYEYLNNL